MSQLLCLYFFFSSRRRHTRWPRDWSSDVCTSDLKSFENLVQEMDKWELEEIIVSSLRMDVILARALNVSRNRAKTLIKDQKVKLNWVEVERPDIEVEEYDILSIRGFGRVKIGAQQGITRKDNLVLKIGIIDRNT